jgi:hypothetical protein
MFGFHHSCLERSVRFRPIEDTSPMSETAPVYRKDAPRLIARDVSKRLSEMRRKVAWADWRMALIATRGAYPDWFKHGETAESVLARGWRGHVDAGKALWLGRKPPSRRMS